MKFTEEKKLELYEAQFRCWVLDKWDWKATNISNKAFYDEANTIYSGKLTAFKANRK